MPTHWIATGMTALSCPGDRATSPEEGSPWTSEIQRAMPPIDERGNAQGFA